MVVDQEQAETYDSEDQVRDYWTSRRATLNEDVETVRKKTIFWLNPLLLKIKEYACTLANKGKVFFSNPSLTLIRSLAQALSKQATLCNVKKPRHEVT